MTTDDTEVVSALCGALADKLGKERYELWFGSGTRFAEDGGRLIVGVPNRFLHDWLRSNMRQEIEEAYVHVLGTPPVLEFHVDPSLAAAGAIASPGPRTDAPDRSPREKNGDLPKDADRPASTPRRRFADMSSFVTGACNRLARSAAEMIVQRPGELSPLVIHGPTGVGKTHLLEGIWSAARRTRPSAGTIYLSAEQFTTHFLQALRGSGLPSFRQKYRGVELLLIDDLQFFCGKRATQIELLYTIDTLMREGRQMVFASDRPPAKLSEFGPEMSARLQAGMVCRIEPPDYETRLGILAQMARRMRVNVPLDVRQFIVSRLTSHARELSGALCRIQAAAQATGMPISLEMAEEALAEMVHYSSRVIRLPDIEKAVCQTFGLEPASLQSGRKAKCVSHPRMLAMWLARKHTRVALSEIGQYFGRRTHSTVISAQSAWRIGSPCARRWKWPIASGTSTMPSAKSNAA